MDSLNATPEAIAASSYYNQALTRYTNEFSAMYLRSLRSFCNESLNSSLEGDPASASELSELMQANVLTFQRIMSRAWIDAFGSQINENLLLQQAIRESWLGTRPGAISMYWKGLRRSLEAVAVDLPASVEKIGAQFGFHFDKSGYSLVAETPRFLMYQVHPTKPVVSTTPCAKPVLLIPPYVLGANVLSFLPEEGRSYAHSFANAGIPTYIRVVRDIRFSEAVQLMTPEDDANDTKELCQRLVNMHGHRVTLNGYCQGGLIAAVNVLSGILDDLVDALIVCVAPLDGSRSGGLREFKAHLPERYQQIGYARKQLPNGNFVVDGSLMALVYKLRSLDSPLSDFYRDLQMVRLKDPSGETVIQSMAAAINRWLTFDRSDIPLLITELSNQSYGTAIKPDGTLPVTLFGRSLSLKRFKERGIRMLVCYGTKDDLVEPASALVLLDGRPLVQSLADAEITSYEKGHIGIAVIRQGSKEALDLTYSNGSRGPVRFHLDLWQNSV